MRGLVHRRPSLRAGGSGDFEIRLPIEKLHVRQAERSRRKEQDRAQTIGVILSAAEGRSRLCLGCRADTGDKSELVQTARIHHVLDQEISRLVHVLMQDEVLRAARHETPADRPSDLHEENRAAFEANRGEPQAYPGRGRARLCLLAQHDIGSAAEDTAGRRPRLARRGDSCGARARCDVGQLADEDGIERIAAWRAARIGRAAGQPLQRRAERGEVLVVGDAGIRVSEGDRTRMRICRVIRDGQEQRERYQPLLWSRSILSSLVRRSGLMKSTPARVSPGRIGFLNAEPVEVVVDACVRFAARAACAGTTRLRAARSSRDRFRGAAATTARVSGSGLRSIPAARAVLLRSAPNMRRLSSALSTAAVTLAPWLGGGHGACAQLCVVEGGGSLPCRTAGDSKEKARCTQCFCEQTQPPTQDREARLQPCGKRTHRSSPGHFHGLSSVLRPTSHGKNSIAASEVGWRSNTRTTRSPSV